MGTKGKFRLKIDFEGMPIQRLNLDDFDDVKKTIKDLGEKFKWDGK